MTRIARGLPAVVLALAIATAPAACSGSGGAGAGAAQGEGGNRGGRPGGGRPDAAQATAAVPVEVVRATRRDISSFIETNGVLEAENEVDLVARIAAPIVDLLVEEGDAVKEGQTLARLEETELRAQLEIARVELDESGVARERADRMVASDLISPDVHEQAVGRHERAKAQFQAAGILLDYARVRAPFSGLIVRRYVDFAEHVAMNTPLFRLSNFTPLLCPIQIPERDLAKVRVGQEAALTVEPWPGERFGARVIRISPVVDAATGTVKVTLEAEGRDRLRPGMFARVFIRTETRAGAIVIPRSALSLESIGETVYVVDGDAARRREVRLGFREGDHVEVVEGIAEGDPVIVVGQDGLSDGTPVRIMDPAGRRNAGAGAAGAGAPEPGGDARPDFSTMTADQIERAKERMRARGMSEEEIDRRIEAARAGQPPRDP